MNTQFQFATPKMSATQGAIKACLGAKSIDELEQILIACVDSGTMTLGRAVEIMEGVATKSVL